MNIRAKFGSSLASSSALVSGEPSISLQNLSICSSVGSLYVSLCHTASAGSRRFRGCSLAGYPITTEVIGTTPWGSSRVSIIWAVVYIVVPRKQIPRPLLWASRQKFSAASSVSIAALIYHAKLLYDGSAPRSLHHLENLATSAQNVTTALACLTIGWLKCRGASLFFISSSLLTTIEYSCIPPVVEALLAASISSFISGSGMALFSM